MEAVSCVGGGLDPPLSLLQSAYHSIVALRQGKEGLILFLHAHIHSMTSCIMVDFSNEVKAYRFKELEVFFKSLSNLRIKRVSLCHTNVESRTQSYAYTFM